MIFMFPNIKFWKSGFYEYTSNLNSLDTATYFCFTVVLFIANYVKLVYRNHLTLT